jgi:uroporphyrinogen decarboxylase
VAFVNEPMNHRQRFFAAIGHQSGDRPPIDIAGTSLTSMSARCQESLRGRLGFTGKPEATNNGVDEKILEWAGTDFRAVGAIVDLPSPHTRVFSPASRVDCWGIQRDHISDFDEITFHPLRGASLQELRDFHWPEPRIEEATLSKWIQRAKYLKEQDEYIVIAEHPVFGILELGCWMCGYDDFLIRLACDPDFVFKFFDIVFEIQMKIIDQYYSALSPYIDLTTSGDDFGMQSGPLISPEMFARYITPYFSERISHTKSLAKCLYWHHTCGSVVDLLDQIIECGVDILNPIQTSAARMEPGYLKQRFGEKLIFWGGVDVQQFLPKATQEEVKFRITNLLQVLGEDGGYVIAPAHNKQDDIPPDNIIAWVESMR